MFILLSKILFKWSHLLSTLLTLPPHLVITNLCCKFHSNFLQHWRYPRVNYFCRKRNFVPNYSVILTLQLCDIKNNQFDMEGNVLSENIYIVFRREIFLCNAERWLMVGGRENVGKLADGLIEKSAVLCFITRSALNEIKLLKRLMITSYWMWSHWHFLCQNWKLQKVEQCEKLSLITLI